MSNERLTSVRRAAELAEQQAAFADSLGQNDCCPLFHVDDGVNRYRSYCQQAAELLRSAEALLSEGRPAAQDNSRQWWTEHGIPSAADSFADRVSDSMGPTEFGMVNPTITENNDCSGGNCDAPR